MTETLKKIDKKNLSAFLLSLAFLASFIINPFGINIFELGKQSYLALFITICIIVFSLNFLKKGKSQIKYNKGIFFIIILWILALFLSSIFGDAPLKSFFGNYIRQGGVLSHLLYISYFFLVINVVNKKNFQAFLLPIFIIGIILSTHAILQKFDFFLIFSSHDISSTGFLGRSFSTFGNPNLLGQFLLFPFFINVYFFLKTKKQKIFLAIPLLIQISAIFFTENRSSLLALFAGTIILFFISKKFKIRLKILIFLLLTSIFASFIFTFTPSLRSLSSRIDLWKIANKSFSENILFGTGLENFENSFHKFVPENFYQNENLFSYADRAHNEFLDFESQLGAFGFVIYLTTILFLLTKFFFTKNKTLEEKIIGISFLSLLITNIFSFSLTLNFLSFYTILALYSIQKFKFKNKKINLTTKTIFIVPLILFAFFLISTNYLKNLTADIYLKQAITGGASPYESFSKAISLNPNQSKIYFYFARYLKESGLDFKAPLYEAKKFENISVSYLIEEASLYMDHSPKTALNSLFKASLIAPNNNEIELLKGKIYFKEEKFSKSIESLEKIISRSPKYISYSENEIKRDQVGYKNFLNKNPEIFEILELLQIAHQKIGNTNKENYYNYLIKLTTLY